MFSESVKITLLSLALATIHLNAAAPQEEISRLQRASNYAELATYLKELPPSSLSEAECNDLRNYLKIKQDKAKCLYKEHMKEAQKAQKSYNDTRNALDALEEIIKPTATIKA